MRDLTLLHQSLAKVTFADRSLSEVLTDIVRIARSALVGAEAASVTLIRGENDFTADVVMCDGRPAGKRGRELLPNPRLERVE